MSIVLCSATKCSVKHTCKRSVDYFKEWFDKCSKPIDLDPIITMDFSIDTKNKEACEVFVPIVEEELNRV